VKPGARTEVCCRARRTNQESVDLEFASWEFRLRRFERDVGRPRWRGHGRRETRRPQAAHALNIEQGGTVPERFARPQRVQEIPADSRQFSQTLRGDWIQHLASRVHLQVNRIKMRHQRIDAARNRQKFSSEFVRTILSVPPL